MTQAKKQKSHQTDQPFDVAIIGGGPGGYVAAIRASQLGLKVALIEKEHLGGICLNWGCIPTKALLRASELHHWGRQAGDFGFKASPLKTQWAKLIQRSRDVAGRLSSGVEHLIKKNKITLFRGEGSLKSKASSGGWTLGIKPTLDTQTKKTPPSQSVKARKVILSTGARARTLPGLADQENIFWTYKEAMTSTTCPKSLLIVGSGAIGVEFASFYQEMGADVTLVEAMDRILPQEDEEISTLAFKAFEKEGMTILTSTSLKHVEKKKGALHATLRPMDKKSALKKEETSSFEKILLAVGIQANVENLGLEKTSIQLDKGHVIANDFCQTADADIYAIGDLAQGPWLAHKASHEGTLAVEHMVGLDVHPLNPHHIPSCTYSHPQVASVGLTEKEARTKGHDIQVGRFPGIGNGKALALGDTHGFVKVIFEKKTGELLGAHMLGPEVTEQIQGLVIAKTLEATDNELIHTIFPHPTLSEMIHEAVLDAQGRALHM